MVCVCVCAHFCACECVHACVLTLQVKPGMLPGGSGRELTLMVNKDSPGGGARVNTMQMGSRQLCKGWKLLVLLQVSEPALGIIAPQGDLQPGSTSRKSLPSVPAL